MSITLPRIFVSHSHKDDEFGVRLVEDLRGVLPDKDAVWYDSRGGLPGGTAWWRTIVDEITNRTIFLVILSPDAMESKWVHDEITLAWQEKNSSRGMLIVPLLRYACTIRADLRSLQIIDFQISRDYNLAFDELLSAIGVAKPENPQHLANQPPRNLLSRIVPQVEAAFNAQDWVDVMRKTDYLLKHAPEDIPANLYLWYGIALQQRSQIEQAQGAFEMALVLVEDREQRLQILKNYADLLISQDRWHEVLSLASEALGLSPDNPDWVLIQQRGQGKTTEKLPQEEPDIWIDDFNQIQNPQPFNTPQVVDEEPDMWLDDYKQAQNPQQLNLPSSKPRGEADEQEWAGPPHFRRSSRLGRLPTTSPIEYDDSDVLPPILDQPMQNTSQLPPVTPAASGTFTTPRSSRSLQPGSRASGNLPPNQAPRVSDTMSPRASGNLPPNQMPRVSGTMSPRMSGAMSPNQPPRVNSNLPSGPLPSVPVGRSLPAKQAPISPSGSVAARNRSIPSDPAPRKTTLANENMS
jgi:tetratricopeptide (TPR) repeat protein